LVGIVSYGIYVPYYRLDFADVADAWGTSLPAGQRAVANFDEDAVTMAVAASSRCLAGIAREKVDGLYFASTSAPYREKQSAALVASAVDLRRDLATCDFANSLRSGTSAMTAAVNAVHGPNAKLVLVAAADCRLGKPKSNLEYTLGDGAAALLLGDADAVATIETCYSISDEMLDYWRLDSDHFIQTWEGRFVLEKGYLDVMRETAQGLFKQYGLKPDYFNKVVYYAPDRKSHRRLAESLGFDLEHQVQDSLIGRVGNSGSACALMMLAMALDEAKAGDTILFLSYGDGCDAFVLRVTEMMENLRRKKGQRVKDYLMFGKRLSSYAKYLALRGITSVEWVRRDEYPSSASLLWREREQIVRLHGYKCRRCGAVQLPRPDTIRVCVQCQAVDDFDRIRLSDTRGTIVSFCIDHVFAAIEPPSVVAVVNLDGGGRFFSLMAEGDAERLKVGARVEMCFRKMSDATGIHNYYWKTRLLEGEP